MARDGRTRWIIDRRLYFFERWKHGIAERVRAERRDDTKWVRVLEAIYWWPEHEGKEWPAMVIAGPVWDGLSPEPDTWGHFEASLGVDHRYRWEQLGSLTNDGRNQARRVPVYAVLRLELDVADPELAVAVKEIMPSLEEAEAEIQRLSRTNSDKNCRYIWRATRYYPDGRRSQEENRDE